MSKGGDDREKRAAIREAAKEGSSASEAGLSTGADKQIGHGDAGAQKDGLHAEKGKS